MANTNNDNKDTNSRSRNKSNDEARNQEQRPLPRVGKRQRLDPVASKVVVVGAGLAGLSVALSLRRAGFRHIEVYERDPSLDYQKEGYGLTLTYNPKGPLSNLGVLETVAQHDCPSRSHYLFRQEESVSEEKDEEQQQERHDDERKHDENDTNTKTKINYGTPIGYFGNAFFDSSSSTSSSVGRNSCRRRRRGYGQRGNLRVPRKVLRRILYQKLLQTQQQQQQEKDDEVNVNVNVSDNADSIIDNKPIVVAVHWNHSLIDYKWDELTQQYHMRFSTNSGDSDGVILNTTADLLVAADGIRSCVLQQLYNSKIAEEEEEEIVSTLTTSPSPLPPIPSIRESPERYGLRPMGVRLILGIADGIDHPLLSERGFYTVDTKGHRLFTMPYHSDRFDFDSNHKNNKINNNKKTANKHRIMWQLSFSTDSKTASPSSLDAKSLREYVLRIFKTWHPPVLDLVRSTPIEMIWGTDLMDRNPRQVYEDLIVGRSAGKKGKKSGCGGGGQSSKQLRQPRLVVCGDALHCMTPFKGQGANQALTDGPLLSKWLLKSSIDASLTNWWRETLNRTVPIVESSRKSAQVWHDPKLILQSSGDEHAEYNGFAGVRPSAIPSLVQTLRRRGIGPHLDGDLDDHIRKVIQEHDWFDDGGENNTNTNVDDADGDNNEENKNSIICKERVLQLASDGDTEGLRQMSLGSTQHHYHYCAAMVEAKDEHGRTCLHLAAMNNQMFTCHWLLVEMRVLKQWHDRQHHCHRHNNHKSSDQNDRDDDDDDDDTTSMKGSGNESAADGPVDINGKTAYDYAVQTGDKKLIHIFQVVMNDEDTERRRENMKIS
jgi:2-polyprenyl-6-methoxyphenol hydroxylase-like FAD-dependent oxidoreductase